MLLERLARGPAALRAMPQYSHMSLPSSRWNESTVRLPLIAEEALRALARLGLAPCGNSGCVGVDRLQLVPTRGSRRWCTGRTK